MADNMGGPLLPSWAAPPQSPDLTRQLLEPSPVRMVIMSALSFTPGSATLEMASHAFYPGRIKRGRAGETFGSSACCQWKFLFILMQECH